MQLTRTAQRLEEAEEMLLTEISVRKGMGLLAQRWGISRSQVKRYIVAVQGRLAEAGKVDREAKIANFRARLRRYQRVAMEREKGYVVQVDRDQQEVETTPDPDVRAAVNAAELEARLDGLLQPIDVKVQHAFSGDTMKNLYKHYYGDDPLELPPTTLRDVEPAKGGDE